MRPPFAYYGGKTRIAPAIADLMPAHRVYVEPFAGSMAVLLAKPPATHEVVNDLDGDVVNFWQQLRERTEDLAFLCWATPYARDEYAAARAAAITGDEDLERARRWWVRISQSHGRTNTTSGWSTGFARSGSRASETVRAAARMPGLLHRLRHVTIENRDALDCIRAYDAPDAVIYADPPYPAQARNSVGYQHEMPDPDAHRRLAEVLHDCDGTVFLSGYACPLYDELFGLWDSVEFDALRSNGGRLGGRNNATEVVWSNRPITTRAQGELQLAEGTGS